MQSSQSPVVDCRNCGPVAPRLYWKPFAGGLYHLGAECPECGRWVKWLNQSPQWLELAPERPTTEQTEMELF
jgi:hypothetical protein